MEAFVSLMTVTTCFIAGNTKGSFITFYESILHCSFMFISIRHKSLKWLINSQLIDPTFHVTAISKCTTNNTREFIIVNICCCSFDPPLCILLDFRLVSLVSSQKRRNILDTHTKYQLKLLKILSNGGEWILYSIPLF